MDYKTIGIFVLGAVLAVGIYIQFFQPLPPEPGMSPEQVKQVENMQKLSQNTIDSLQSEIISARKNKQYYHQLYNSVLKQIDNEIKNVPSEPLEINLKSLTFEQKVDLFNEIVK